MLLRFFRINDPYRLLGVLFILILISVPFLIYMPGITTQQLSAIVVGEALDEGKLMYVQLFDDTPPVLAMIYGLLDLLFGRSLLSRNILAIVLIFFQASLFSILLINRKAYVDNTYLPALIFVVLSFLSFDMITTSAELISCTLLLLVINNLFKEIEFKIQKDETILNLGIFLGLATLLVFSHWIFLPGSLVILFIFSRMTPRKTFLLLFGFALPHLITITLYFYWDKLDFLVTNFYSPNFTFHSEKLIPWNSILILGAIPLAYLFFAVIMMNRQARLTKYQSQLVQVMFVWLIICLMSVLMSRELSPASLMVMIPPFAYFIAYYLLLIRRKWIAEIMLWIFTISVLAFSFLSMRGAISRVDYARLFPNEKKFDFRDKKVMVLGEDKAVFLTNQLGGSFFNWTLSKPVFENPDRYYCLEIVAESFQQDPPEVIIDNGNYIEAVMDRIPSVKENYQKKGSNYWRISN